MKKNVFMYSFFIGLTFVFILLQARVGSAESNPVQTVDIMIVYTEDVAINSGGEDQLIANMNDAVATLNRINDNSGVLFDFNLVHTEQIDHVQAFPFDLQPEIDMLIGGTGIGAQVHDLRDQHVADLVTMWVPFSPGLCGIGPAIDTAAPARADFAYSVVNFECANSPYSLAMARYWGPALGLSDESAIGIATDSNGYRVPGEFRTIMSQPCVGEEPDCPLVEYWSNPAISISGLATGLVDEADNARILNTNAGNIASYRTSTTTFISLGALKADSSALQNTTAVYFALTAFAVLSLVSVVQVRRSGL